MNLSSDDERKLVRAAAANFVAENFPISVIRKLIVRALARSPSNQRPTQRPDIPDDNKVVGVLSKRNLEK